MKHTQNTHSRKDGGHSGGSPGPVTFSVSRVRVLGLGILCLLFALACLSLVFLDSDTAGNRFTAVVVGVMGCVFFGAGGAFFVWKKLREPAVLTLTPAGIRVQSAGFIPWANLDAVGVGRTPGGPYGAKIIGIRLKSQKQLVETMSPQEQRLMRGAARVGRAAGFALPAGRHPGQRALRSVPRQDPVAIMEWTRSTTGWDLSWSPMLFNHRSTTVVEMIETYRRSVRRSSSPDTFPPHR